MEALPQYVNGLVALLLFSSFVKITTALSVLRYGLGLRGVSFGIATVALSLALTSLIMGDRLNLMQIGAVSNVSAAEAEARYRPFIEKHADSEIVTKLSALALQVQNAPHKKNVAGNETVGMLSPPAVETILKAQPIKTSFDVLVSSFLITELRGAVELGLLFIIPFVVIDLLVTNAFMALGITQLKVIVVSLPIKLLLFVAIDGWTKVAEKLIQGYV